MKRLMECPKCGRPYVQGIDATLPPNSRREVVLRCPHCQEEVRMTWEEFQGLPPPSR